MTDKFDPGLSDQALDRVLGELKAPSPSDLLRARLDNAMGTDGDAQRAASPSRSRRPAPRAALFARMAAALLLAAGTGLAAWLPAPVPATGWSWKDSAASCHQRQRAFELVLVSRSASFERSSGFENSLNLSPT